jgi:aspartate ammonia-lyase
MSTATLNPTGATRDEKDSLGVRQVPADAYYGVQALRGHENFQDVLNTRGKKGSNLFRRV